MLSLCFACVGYELLIFFCRTCGLVKRNQNRFALVIIHNENRWHWDFDGNCLEDQWLQTDVNVYWYQNTIRKQKPQESKQTSPWLLTVCYFRTIGTLLIHVFSLSLPQPIPMNRTLSHFSMSWSRAAWGYGITCCTCPLPARMNPSFGNGSPEGGSSTWAPPSVLESPSATWAHWATGRRWACSGAITSPRGSAGPGAAAGFWIRWKRTCPSPNWSSTVATRQSSAHSKSQGGESMATIRTFVPSPTKVSL